MDKQIDLFSFSTPTYKFPKDKEIVLIELFAGIGSQMKALKRLQSRGKLKINLEKSMICEFDKYAVGSYNEVHDTDFKPSDVTKLTAADLNITDKDKYTYVLTYSFPCQDISQAGLMRGFDKGSGTRSGLLWEVERILDECNGNLPDVLLMENVPGVIGTKNISNFQLWRSKLESLGYSNFVQILNSKDYGIPQNRARCFMVSILGDYHYEFPSKIPLKLKLKDMLEDNVPDKYFLSDAMVEYFVKNNEEQKVKGNGFTFDPLTRERERAKSITTNSCRMDNNYIDENR